jgi:hypothetical protein
LKNIDLAEPTGTRATSQPSVGMSDHDCSAGTLIACPMVRAACHSLAWRTAPTNSTSKIRRPLRCAHRPKAADENITVDSVAVTNDILRCCFPTVGLRQLACDPFSRWVRGCSQPLHDDDSAASAPSPFRAAFLFQSPTSGLATSGKLCVRGTFCHSNWRRHAEHTPLRIY